MPQNISTTQSLLNPFQPPKYGFLVSWIMPGFQMPSCEKVGLKPKVGLKILKNIVQKKEFGHEK